MSSAMTLRDRLPAAADADSIFLAFVDGVTADGLELYPAQEQAIIELMSGKHVILSTPTGSGKSLVAEALEFKALAEKKRAYYTCPIKALVSEKFFALCRDLGAENVGMVTGDASINGDAPVVCCTAEILSNLSLREGESANVAYVIMDEFHYYGDRDRGVAWQIPLLMLPQATFLLMSATLGDTTAIERSIEDLTGRELVVVRSYERPVPLDYIYSEDPLHETIQKLVERDKAPIYLVNFTQRDAAEQAQNLLSVDFSTRQEKQRIADVVRGFRFDTPYGREIQRFIRHGVGLHHAGLLPKYRLLVEQLAQQGALKVVSGTDTLGVGVNVPIRTVLFTQLAKFDGQKMTLLSVRDFKQVAGRAGRRGFDTQGTVVCQAPEHVIENKRLEAKAGPNKKKLVKKKAPPNFVPWDEKTFKQLIERDPEPLESRFIVSHAMLLTLLQQPSTERGGGYGRLVRLIGRSHERPAMRSRHRRRARDLFRSLVAGGIVSVVRNRLHGARIVVNDELQRNFSLNQTLSLFLLDALIDLDRDSDSYALDVVSLVESILESPRVILMAQLSRAKGERIAELKAAGMEYNERMEELEKVEHPKPNAEQIYGAFDVFRVKHPWAAEDNVRPKSIAREMYEKVATFHEYIREYGLERSEGVLLRYLSDFYRTLAQTVPETYKNDALFEIAVYFRGMLERVDDSLVREWEQLVNPTDGPAVEVAKAREHVFDPLRDMRGFTARVRTELHQIVKALADKAYARVLEIVRDSGVNTNESVAAMMEPYWTQHAKLRFDHEARLPSRTQLLQEGPRQFRARQTLADPEGTDEWLIEATIDLDEATEPDAPLLTLVRVGT